MATTNEQIVERIDKFETNVNERFDRQDARISEVEKESKVRDAELRCDIEKNDETLRGNGKKGLNAQVDANTKAIEKIEKYSQAIIFLIVGEFLARVFGVI